MTPRRTVAVLLCACLPAACTDNPLFLLDPGDNTTGGVTIGASDTGGQPTSTTSVEVTNNTGPDSTADTSAGVTTGFTSTPSTGTTGEPGSTSTGPGSGETSSGETSTGESLGGSSSESTGDPPGCGDASLSADEECDEGPNNSDAGACTLECKLAKCGDGLTRLQGDDPEVCDAGPDNGGGLGKCSIDCRGLVPLKTYEIAVSGTLVNGTLRDTDSMLVSGIAAGDDTCKLKFGPKYKVLAADGVQRRATMTPWEGDQRLDWVLKPYTGYVNANGDLLGITGSEALLGVQNDAMMPIAKAITPGQGHLAWTGLHADWTTAENCINWTTSSEDKHGKAGNSGSTSGWLDGAGPKNCLSQLQVYCVEQ